MKKFKKTYAIFHLTEKHTVFYLGKTKVHVSFTGGIVTKRGVTPATFTTDDPIVQFAIEQSADFKKGAISIRSKYPVQGEVKIGKNEPERAATITELIREAAQEGEPVPALRPKQEPAKAETAEAAEVMETEANALHLNGTAPRGLEAPEQETEAHDGEAEAQDGETEAHDGETGGSEKESGLEEVEASCKDVAKQYLQEHFGERPAPLRTIADVQECAAKHGIKFVFV